MKIWPLLYKITLGIFIGFYSSALYLEQNKTFQYIVLKSFKSIFENSFKSTFNGSINSIHIFPFRIIFKNIVVEPLLTYNNELEKKLPKKIDDQWSWQAESLDLNFYLFSWFYNNKKILLSTKISNGFAYSNIIKGYPLIILE